MGIDRYVTFTGFIPYSQLYEILSTSDACVNPEFKNDFTDKSTMIKIMDYMVFRKPIVQFETTEGKATAGKAAIYIKNNNEIEFAEALVKLLKDKQKCKKMGNVGWSRIYETLNWKPARTSNIKRIYILFQWSGHPAP